MLKDSGSLLVAFSGGVDSSLLLSAAAAALPGKVRAMIARAPIYPQRETKDAVRFCETIGVPFDLVEPDALGLESFVRGDADRCYHCKKLLLTLAFDVAKRYGIGTVADGTNADDHLDYRPGEKALAESGAISPLAKCGLTKNDVRALARQLGLANWDKPAAACLASRFPYGTPVTKGDLARIEACEEFLLTEGFSQFRVRFHGEVARLEVAVKEIERFADKQLRERVDAAIRGQGFSYVALDLRGYRTGSLNESLKGFDE